MKRGIVLLLFIWQLYCFADADGRVRHSHRRDSQCRAAKTQDRKRMVLCRRKRGSFWAGSNYLYTDLMEDMVGWPIMVKCSLPEE